jgi:hypothetical protein
MSISTLESWPNVSTGATTAKTLPYPIFAEVTRRNPSRKNDSGGENIETYNLERDRSKYQKLIKQLESELQSGAIDSYTITLYHSND